MNVVAATSRLSARLGTEEKVETLDYSPILFREKAWCQPFFFYGHHFQVARASPLTHLQHFGSARYKALHLSLLFKATLLQSARHGRVPMKSPTENLPTADTLHSKQASWRVSTEIKQYILNYFIYFSYINHAIIPVKVLELPWFSTKHSNHQLTTADQHTVSWGKNPSAEREGELYFLYLDFSTVQHVFSSAQRHQMESSKHWVTISYSCSCVWGVQPKGTSCCCLHNHFLDF